MDENYTTVEKELDREDIWGKHGVVMLKRIWCFGLIEEHTQIWNK